MPIGKIEERNLSLMGPLEEYIYKLAKAIHNKDKKRRDEILAELRKLGMDSSTALTLAMDYSVDP